MRTFQTSEEFGSSGNAAQTRSTVEVTVTCESASDDREECERIDVCDMDACDFACEDDAEEGYSGFWGGDGLGEFIGYNDFPAYDEEFDEWFGVVDEECDDPRALSPKELGRRGEEAACALLQRKDYVILERNWTCPAGEADIIALDDGCIVFIEVKTRAGIERGLPEEAVTARKRARYERIAGFFLSDYDGPGGRVRFDVVGVLALPQGRALARHVVNAFGVGD